MFIVILTIIIRSVGTYKTDLTILDLAPVRRRQSKRPTQGDIYVEDQKVKKRKMWWCN